jgi:putative drug exporter of the RND superfamily
VRVYLVEEMLDRLAALAERRGRLVVALSVVFFLAAGALGGGVADRLIPYDASDPDTESVEAEELLEDAGYRDTDVVVMFEDTDVRTPEGRERVREISDELAERDDVDQVVGYLDTGSKDFISRDGEGTYLSVRLSATRTRASGSASRWRASPVCKSAAPPSPSSR